MMSNEETRPCVSNFHKPHHGVIYPKDAVPIRFFRVKSKGLIIEYYGSCDFCRELYRQYNQKRDAEEKRLYQERLELVKLGESDLMYCPNPCHNKICGSKFPRDAVPTDMFKSEIEGKWHFNCSDCRTYTFNVETNRRKKISSKAKEEGRVLCSNCKKDITDTRKITKRGTLSSKCENCREYARRQSANARARYREIKLERIKKHQMSCMKCQCLYFSPKTEDSLAVTCVKTYLKGNTRYCTIENVERKVADVIEKSSHLLELSIIEMDHLTMQEQLSLGIIQSEAEYEGKKGSVGTLSHFGKVNRESVKCQHLCSRCHVIVTMERHKETDTGTILARKKLSYVRSLKAEGCSSCGYRNILLPRFFEMDHVGVKRKDVSGMCYDPNFTIGDVVDECKQCRVLCKFCHRIHTNRQIKAGIKIPKASQPIKNSTS